MTYPGFSVLADLHALGEDSVPTVVSDLAAGRAAELVWRNELDGLTFRIDNTYVEYIPRQTGIDVERELRAGTRAEVGAERLLMPNGARYRAVDIGFSAIAGWPAETVLAACRAATHLSTQASTPYG